jgi:hypothetical protein
MSDWGLYVQGLNTGRNRNVLFASVRRPDGGGGGGGSTQGHI